MWIRAALVTGALALAMACGPPSEPESAPDSAHEAEPFSFGGRYHVTGVTIDQATGAQRPIQGTIVLNEVEGGSRYTSHVELETLFPGSDAVAAEVVGTGEGDVSGRRLVGTAETQLVAASVPGVDTGFAFVPREVGQRIRSSAIAEIKDDGTVSLEIHNEPAEGEAEYTPTKTLLVGYRAESD
jgi:hypothetical protein